MENTSDSFMPGPLLFCMKIEKSVYYSVPDNIGRTWQDGGKSMSKYDKMLEINHKQSVEKIQRAKLAIQKMIEEEDKVTVPKLIQKTGLSRGFFYKNPKVRKVVDHALQLQAGMVDKRRKILDMAMDSRILQLEQQVAKLKRENETLRKENEAMRKALNKRDLNLIKNF